MVSPYTHFRLRNHKKAACMAACMNCLECVLKLMRVNDILVVIDLGDFAIDLHVASDCFIIEGPVAMRVRKKVLRNREIRLNFYS
jgi:hypothetical protein